MAVAQRMLHTIQLNNIHPYTFLPISASQSICIDTNPGQGGPALPALFTARVRMTKPTRYWFAVESSDGHASEEAITTVEFWVACVETNAINRDVWRTCHEALTHIAQVGGGIVHTEGAFEWEEDTERLKLYVRGTDFKKGFTIGGIAEPIMRMSDMPFDTDLDITVSLEFVEVNGHRYLITRILAISLA